jgi:hypothetical protein
MHLGRPSLARSARSSRRGPLVPGRLATCGYTSILTHHIWLPQSLGNTVQLVGSSSSDCKVFRSSDTSNTEQLAKVAIIIKPTYVSMVEIKGLGLGSSSVGVGSPATTGSMKNGPNRFSYNVLETRWVNVFGVISLSSFIRYMLTRNRRCSLLPNQLGSQISWLA